MKHLIDSDMMGPVNAIPFTTTGDIMVSGANGVPNRVAIGSDGQVLTSTGTTINWETPVNSTDADTLDGLHATSFMPDVLTSVGDIPYRQIVRTQTYESSVSIGGKFNVWQQVAGAEVTANVAGNVTIILDMWISGVQAWGSSRSQVWVRRDNVDGAVIYDTGQFVPGYGTNGHAQHIQQTIVDEFPTTGKYVLVIFGYADMDTYSNYRKLVATCGTNSPVRLPIGTTGQVLSVSSSGLPSWITPQPQTTLFTINGVLTVGSNPLRIYNTSAVSRTISKVFVAVNTAPTDASILVDIHKNGTTIFTTQSNRPAISSTNFTGQTTVIEVPTWAAGEYLQVNVDQVGSTIAGADLSVHILWS
jgi:hypothetical protein